LTSRSRPCPFPLTGATTSSADSRLLPRNRQSGPLIAPLPGPAPLSPAVVRFSPIYRRLLRALVPARAQPVRPFANKTTAMDSSSDDDISTIANLNNEFFYTHFFDDWSNSEFEDDAYLMVAVASILHKETRSICHSRGAPCQAELPIW
jgi:hypothetical protein